MSTSEFAKMIKEDPSIWLDKQGHVFYVEAEEPTELSTSAPLTTRVIVKSGV